MKHGLAVALALVVCLAGVAGCARRHQAARHYAATAPAAVVAAHPGPLLRARCRLKAKLLAANAGMVDKETALSFSSLAPRTKLETMSIALGKSGTFVVAGDRACPLEPTAVASLVAPITTLSQAHELVARFEPGVRRDAKQARRLLEALAAQGLLRGPPPKLPAPVAEKVTLPSGETAFHVRVVLARDDTAEIRVASFLFAGDGRAARRDRAWPCVPVPADLRAAFAPSGSVAPEATTPQARRAAKARAARLAEIEKKRAAFSAAVAKATKPGP